ncbi:putative chitinase 3 [Dufourea novaeangliae]|uniref:Putative chitinase 3 n=1 Tax=Dufourea novaeangliae TaxID=178035 RepID=A0A154PSG5_DUFNO|nr:putative chitinase 3 [Dufourea novaeangliae]
MTVLLVLVLAGLSAAGPSYRIPTYELLPPPPWDPNFKQTDVEMIEVPPFQRGAVESPPMIDNSVGGPVTHEEYGSQRFPLRDAVEFVPAHAMHHQGGSLHLQEMKEPEGRVPLRDAVEHREAPFFSGVDHESIWIEPLAPPTLTRTQRITDPKVICHLDSSAVHRTEPFSLFPQSVPDHKCSHLVYAAATLDPERLTVVSRDREYDEIKGGYKSVTGLRLRDPALRVFVSISAPNRGKLFSEVTKNHCSLHCERFAKSILSFLKDHDFDGVEIDWETSSENPGVLKLLLNTLKKNLVPHGYSLAVAQRPSDPVDPEISSVVDLLLFRAWRESPAFRREKLALHPAPLRYVARVTNKWIDRVPPEHRSKIILGLPVFGQGYTLKFGNFTDAGAPIVGPGNGDLYAKQSNGRLAYYEVCEKLEDDRWNSGRDEEGPYIKRGDQWIGYEDPIAVKIKVAYVRSVGLGGVSVWSLDMDDFQGICGNPWPMLNAATESIGFYDETQLGKCSSVDGLFADPDDCSKFYSCHEGVQYHGSCGYGKYFDPEDGRCTNTISEVCKYSQTNRIQVQSSQTDARDPQPENLEISTNKGPRVVCYITSWSLYRKGDGTFPPERLDHRLCTDVIYAFAGLNPDTLLLQPFDPWADIENNLYERVTGINGKSRVLLAIGGWTDSSGDKYSRLISSVATRRKFVAATINFLRKHNFDGLSFEWNYPKCWQSDCRKGPDSDRPNFTKLIRELKNEFDQQQPKLTLAVALSGYKEVIDRAYEVDEISKTVDFVSVMTYDYHGAWESRTGHLSPLFGRPGDVNPYYNVNSTMEYLVGLGAEKSKLLVGVPLYGQAYRLSSNESVELGDPATGPGASGEFTRQPGMLAYYEICDRLKNKGWKHGSGPSAYHKDQWVGFDDRESVYAKGEHILQNGYGGAALWTVDLDDFLNRCCEESFPLLKTMNRALGRLKTKPAENCRRPTEPVTPQPPTLTTHSDAVEDTPRPTTPMAKPTTWPAWSPSTSTQGTTWPSWSPKPSTTTQGTTWPSWTWTPEASKMTESTTRSSVSWTWTSTKPTSEEATVEITDDTQKPLESSEPGSACNTGDYTADPGNCGNYFRCVLGELKREQCAPGLHWDTGRGICDWPATAKCQTGTGSTTQRPSWTTTTASTVTSTTRRPTRPPPSATTTQRASTQRPIVAENPNRIPEKSCEHGQYYPYPDSCTNFLVCVNGNLVSQQCGPGLNWNKERSMCDWAFKNPCVDKPMKNAALVSADAKSIFFSSNSSQPCIPGSYTNVPGDCESYQACLWGRHEVFHCAPGLHFNKNTRICDWPARANCQDDVSTEIQNNGESDSKPISSSTQKPWEPSTTTTLPSPTIDPEEVSPLSGYYKVVCYFTNWAWYRRGIGRYLPENIDHTLCTHIVYGFAVLDYSELTIKAHDSWADYDNRFYERVVAYKKRGLKVLLALGGWNDSAGDKYSRLVNSPAARRKFIAHAVQFLEKYDFDGLDLDWEYPVCWQVDCGKGPASDKQGFADLLMELSNELKPKGLLLSAAVSPSKKVIDKGYDVPALAKYLDWIAVMTYDFHGQWDKKTGHVAPLYYHPDDDYTYFNANYSIHYWIAKGAPRRSIVMGSFSINDPSAGTGLNVPASAGQAGEFTRAAGFLSYYEICDRIRNRGWTAVQDPERRMGPYAYKGNQWVSFDDAEMIEQKAQFVRDMGLGGGMIWALDLDDFRGRCADGPHPLMRALQQVLSEAPEKEDKPEKPPIIEEDDLDPPPVTTTISSSIATSTVTSSTSRDHLPNDEYKVICYFTNWAWYRQEGGKFLPEDVDTDLCTHVLYGFAVLDGSQLTIKSHDPWADVDNKFYERIAALKSKGIKVLMAIGGWNDSAGDKYSRLANSPSARRRFIENVIEFIEKYDFEGLDLDWEYPVCWQVDCKKGPAVDKEGFANLVKELSEAFQPKGLLLSAAVSPSKRVIDEGYDVPTLAKYLDWISVMTYDYHGQWDKKTGHVAPMYQMPNDWEPTFNANFTIHYWMEKGAPPTKLVMGAPLYGQSFSLAERSQRGLNAPTYGGGEAGEATRARGFLSYYEICERTLKKGWSVVQDKERRIGPYAFKGDQWVSFDDARQIKLKAELIKDLGLAGGMVWALDLDDFKNVCDCEPSPLLRTMNRVLRNYPKGPLCPVTTEFTTIDAGLSTEEPTTTEQPSWGWEPTTSSSSPGPTYLPAATSTSTISVADVDDVVEIEAEERPEVSPPEDCHGRLFVPHKKDCSKYFLCNFGRLTEHSCPSGLYWNEDRCDWPENSKCKETQRQSNELLSGIGSTKKTEKKVICYLMKWSRKRTGGGQFLPEDIVPNTCTHIVYGLSTLDTERLTIQNPAGDEQREMLDKIANIKSRTGVKVLLGLGGWEESKNGKYSKLAHNTFERQKFARHASRYLEAHGFDGLDLIWEYPVCWQVDCNRGPASDRKAFALLLRELNALFEPKGLLLSATVSAGKRVIDVAYDVPSLVKYLDWIGVASYDYHGPWEHRTGHVAPLYPSPNERMTHSNVNFSITYWLEQGVPSSKLVMGIPSYGQSFTLVETPEVNVIPGLNARSSGPGHPGESTKSAGFLAYYEICNNVKNRGWSAIKDPNGLIGPYATKGNQWVSYDDVSTVLRKAELINDLNLAGAMMWSMDLDDFKNGCGCGRYPLLRALSQELRGKRQPRMDCT